LNTTTLDDITAPSGDLSMNTHKITDLVGPTLSGDAVNKSYVDNNFYSTSTTLDQIAVPTADLSLNSQKITNLADPTVGTDALNLQTADARYISSSLGGSLDMNGE
jgi:hypothetical protein